MANQSNITAEYVRSILEYDPDTGHLIYKKSTSNRIKIGNIAGSIGKNGYLRVSINNKDYYCHRIIFLITEGYFPRNEVDHINGNKLDNRLINLRKVTKNQNMHNSKKKITNKSGLKGIVKRDINKYISQITKNGKTVCIGIFDCPAAASFAYQIEADKNYGEFARPF